MKCVLNGYKDENEIKSMWWSRYTSSIKKTGKNKFLIKIDNDAFWRIERNAKIIRADEANARRREKDEK